jgi:hypothetical protein
MSELLSWTSKKIQFAIMTRSIFSTAYPTPLITTLRACHMVASFILLNSNFTPRTIANISGLSGPFNIFTIHILLTFSSFTMESQSTIKTHLKLALTHYLLFLAILFHIAIAIRLRAPFETRIHINIYILFELQVLIIDFL